MFESTDRVAQLRRKLARIEQGRPSARTRHSRFDHADLDRVLGGGLARGRLHEVYAADGGDAGSAAGFAAMLGCELGGAIVWLRTASAEQRGGRLHAPGLCEIGLDPARLILGVLPDAQAVLRAGLDVVRCPDVGAAVIELWGAQPRLDLTASRRLAVAAEASGVTVLVLRIAAEAVPSAAHTRWGVRAAASAPLEAGAPGHAALEVELLRQRGGPEGARWLLEWDRDQRRFRDEDQHAGRAAPYGAVVPLSAGGPLGAGAAAWRNAG
ncbi:ImuA family protein [Sphingomonas gilva]|uniref:ImuA family protein n=1 Tax=Sphingomonas gilva TaxID=2305907 RepID=UPI0015FBF40B|nr:hypothetical protein [Sphingomonas gilva]